MTETSGIADPRTTLLAAAGMLAEEQNVVLIQREGAYGLAFTDASRGMLAEAFPHAHDAWHVNVWFVSPQAAPEAIRIALCVARINPAWPMQQILVSPETFPDANDLFAALNQIDAI
jgi:hypothetical protein